MIFNMKAVFVLVKYEKRTCEMSAIVLFDCQTEVKINNIERLSRVTAE